MNNAIYPFTDLPTPDTCRIRTQKDLETIKEELSGEIALRLKENPEDAKYEKHVLICGSTGCTSSGSKKVAEKLQEELEAKDLSKKVLIVRTGCFGLCALGPIMIVYPEGTFYSKVKLEEIPRIVDEHLIGGKPVREFLYEETVPEGNEHIKALEETEFYSRQHRIALRNCGVINPENICEYIARDGYFALGKILSKENGMTPEEVIECIKISGLAGRGGAGFPTWFKWNAARQAKGEIKYLICNADEGDPGAFMDRSVIESDPHTVLEGMLIAAYAIGAREAIIYVRAEYPLAIRRLECAISQARDAGLIGENILGSGFCCDFHIKAGAGAFVCGEETALIESLQGQRGMPRLKPPFPAEQGYWYQPSNINNVETFANVPWIINHGGEAFAAMGTENSKGTKVFALTGKIRRGGLVEIPMGMTLREVIFDIGGGIPEGKKFKAVQMGGPSGGCIPEKLLDTVIDYKKLSETGAIMGSGGMVVMDETTCMVSMAKFFLDFTAKESCGKCVHCRIGTKRMQEILTRIVEGKGREGDIELLEELCNAIHDGALCGLGQTAPNPVLTALRYFRDEFEAHIYEKRCPAHTCTALLRYEIDPDKCRGCTACARKCPGGAISGTVKQAHSIDTEKCLRCGQCLATCKFGAISVN